VWHWLSAPGGLSGVEKRLNPRVEGDPSVR
jgi:hypothetical protein